MRLRSACDGARRAGSAQGDGGRQSQAAGDGKIDTGASKRMRKKRGVQSTQSPCGGVRASEAAAQGGLCDAALHGGLDGEQASVLGHSPGCAGEPRGWSC